MSLKETVTELENELNISKTKVTEFERKETDSQDEINSLKEEVIQLWTINDLYKSDNEGIKIHSATEKLKFQDIIETKTAENHKLRNDLNCDKCDFLVVVIVSKD